MVSHLETPSPDELRAFVAVARRLSVTAAAAALGLPKSAVSKRLSALEQRLNVKLLARASRRVSLTHEGALLLPRAESILAELERLVSDARDEATLISGTVRIAASPEFGAWLARHLLPDLLVAYPALKLAMRLDYAREDLFDPAFDLAFRIGEPRDERLVVRPLGSLHRVLVAAPAFVAAHPVREPADLVQHPALLFSDERHQAVWTLAAPDGGALEDVPVSGRLALHSFTALLEAAASGQGIARVPGFLAAPALARGEVLAVLPGWRSPPTPISLVHRFGADRIARVRAVIDTALRRVPPLLAP